MAATSGQGKFGMTPWLLFSCSVISMGAIFWG